MRRRSAIVINQARERPPDATVLVQSKTIMHAFAKLSVPISLLGRSRAVEQAKRGNSDRGFFLFFFLFNSSESHLSSSGAAIYVAFQILARFSVFINAANSVSCANEICSLLSVLRDRAGAVLILSVYCFATRVLLNCFVQPCGTGDSSKELELYIIFSLCRRYEACHEVP